MTTSLILNNPETINAGDSILIGSWRFLADSDKLHFRIQTFVGMNNYTDSAVIETVNTTEFFRFVYAGIGFNELQLQDDMGNVCIAWSCSGATNVIAWSIVVTDPVFPDNLTDYDMVASTNTDEFSASTLTCIGAIVCFHPDCFINGKRAADYLVGDSLVSEYGKPISILEVVNFGSPEHFVSFLPNCFEKNVPDKEIIVTKGHYIKWRGQSKCAIVWLRSNNIGRLVSYKNTGKIVHFVTSGNEILNFIKCNNLLVDTMGYKHPWIKDRALIKKCI